MGVLVLIVGLGVLGFGFWNHLKGKRILAAPFKTTGELKKDPTSSDPKGAMSTEGAIKPPAKQLLAPCSGTPCIYYEVKVERLWEKVETTQDGTKTVKGSDTLDTVKGGAIVQIDDGTGSVEVDFSKGADFDNFKETFKKELNGSGGSSHIQFGQMTFDVPVLSDREKYTVGFKATEKSVAADGGTLFVLGKLEGSRIVKPGWRSMMTSSKGREGLLGSIQKAKKFSFIGGGVVTAAAVPVMIFAPSVDTKSFGGCQTEMTDAVVKCSDSVTSSDGDTFHWTVTTGGKFNVNVISPKKKIALIPEITLTGADGAKVIDETGAPGETTSIPVEVKAGKYDLVVKGIGGDTIKGGYSYDLEIVSTGPAMAGDAPGAAADPAGAEPAMAAEPAPEEPAAVAPPPAKPAPAPKKIGKPVNKKMLKKK
ncbi:MAG: hypothetical protein K1X89_26075 [Myxococcaceae bacterium]|nr:hypothetical protein [Myxococcaceae bacterium]